MLSTNRLNNFLSIVTPRIDLAQHSRSLGRQVVIDVLAVDQNHSVPQWRLLRQ